MNHAVGRWLKVGVLTFVTAALVACAGAAGKPGEPGADAEVPPLPVGTIPDQTLEVAESGTVALASYFSEGEGETLTYTKGLVGGNRSNRIGVGKHPDHHGSGRGQRGDYGDRDRHG